MKSGPYLQFPLTTLRTFPVHLVNERTPSRDVIQRNVSRLIGYGVVRNGRILYEKIYGAYRPESGALSDRQREMVEGYLQDSHLMSLQPSSFDPSEELLLATAAFFSQTGLAPFGSPELLADQHQKLEEMLELLEVDANRVPMVRVRCDLLHDWRVGKLKHFDMLGFCAIQSMIGSQPFRRITRDQIAVRMLGFPSKSSFELDAGDVLKKAIPSQRRISRMIERLHQRGLTAVARPSKRENFFSVSLSDDLLFDAVKDFKLGSIERRYARRKRDLDLQASLREQREAVKSSF